MSTFTLTYGRQADTAWPVSTTQLLETADTWLQRARQRRQLAQLGDRQLADIGISRAAAQAEAAKPFWQA